MPWMTWDWIGKAAKGMNVLSHLCHCQSFSISGHWKLCTASFLYFSFVYACMYETWMHEHVCDLSVETWVYYEHLHQLCSVIYMEASALTEPKAHWWANTASQLVRGSPVPHFKKLRFQAGCSICPRFIYVDAGDLTSRVFCIEPSP